MDDEKIASLLKHYHKSFENIGVTLQWVKSFLTEHPTMVEIPKELMEKIETSRLEIYDCKNMIETRLNSLGNKDEIS
jgi:hypothetical protein